MAHLVTYISKLSDVEYEKGANNEQEDAGELLASNASTVLAFWLLAPALAPAESALRRRRYECFVLARDTLKVFDVDSGTSKERSALAFHVRVTRKDGW